MGRGRCDYYGRKRANTFSDGAAGARTDGKLGQSNSSGAQFQNTGSKAGHGDHRRNATTSVMSYGYSSLYGGAGSGGDSYTDLTQRRSQQHEGNGDQQESKQALTCESLQSIQQHHTCPGAPFTSKTREMMIDAASAAVNDDSKGNKSCNRHSKDEGSNGMEIHNDDDATHPEGGRFVPRNCFSQPNAPALHISVDDDEEDVGASHHLSPVSPTSFSRRRLSPKVRQMVSDASKARRAQDTMKRPSPKLALGRNYHHGKRKFGYKDVASSLLDKDADRVAYVLRRIQGAVVADKMSGMTLSLFKRSRSEGHSKFSADDNSNGRGPLKDSLVSRGKTCYGDLNGSNDGSHIAKYSSGRRKNGMSTRISSNARITTSNPPTYHNANYHIPTAAMDPKSPEPPGKFSFLPLSDVATESFDAIEQRQAAASPSLSSLAFKSAGPGSVPKGQLNQYCSASSPISRPRDVAKSQIEIIQVPAHRVFNLGLSEGHLLVDIREKDCYMHGHIASAIPLPPPKSELTEEMYMEGVLQILDQHFSKFPFPRNIQSVVIYGHGDELYQENLCNNGNDNASHPSSAVLRREKEHQNCLIRCLSILTRNGIRAVKQLLGGTETREKGEIKSDREVKTSGGFDDHGDHWNNNPNHHRVAQFVRVLEEKCSEVWLLSKGYRDFQRQFPNMCDRYEPSFRHIRPTPKVVAPGIYIGSSLEELCVRTLSSLNISALIVNKGLRFNFSKHGVSNKLSIVPLDVPDDDDEKGWSNAWIASSGFLRECTRRKVGVVIYVHSFSRSLSIGCAYMMISAHVSPVEAVKRLINRTNSASRFELEKVMIPDLQRWLERVQMSNMRMNGTNNGMLISNRSHQLRYSTSNHHDRQAQPQPPRPTHRNLEPEQKDLLPQRTASNIAIPDSCTTRTVSSERSTPSWNTNPTATSEAHDFLHLEGSKDDTSAHSQARAPDHDLFTQITLRSPRNQW